MPTIAFFDSRLTDVQILIAALSKDTEAVLFDGSRDGLQQIANALVGRSGLDNIQIFSHGSSGSLQLGTTTLNSSNLADYQTTLAQIGSALTATGDLLLYGCNVAQGIRGQAFIEQLAQLTGADVAASDDLTGNAALGGDWILEANTGTIESVSAFNATALQNYDSILATAPTAIVSIGTTAFTEAKDALSTAVVIDSGITVTDVDSATLATATVSITGGYLSNQDVLLSGQSRLKVLENII